MRLIDADALFKEYERVAWYNNADRDEIAEEVLLQMPTIDPESLRLKGEWIYHECVSSHDGTKSGYSCSQCCAFVDEEVFDMDEFHKDFCGCCGADMRKEAHNEC